MKTVLDALYFGGELERKHAAVPTTVMETLAGGGDSDNGSGDIQSEEGDGDADGDQEDKEIQIKSIRIVDDIRNCKYRLAPRARSFACLARVPCIFTLVSQSFKFYSLKLEGIVFLHKMI